MLNKQAANFWRKRQDEDKQKTIFKKDNSIDCHGIIYRIQFYPADK